MALQLIGAGYGRTGTLSLKHALEELGFGPCYHMEEVIKLPFRYRVWQKIVDGESPDWDAVFAGYHATVDWPACNYYQDLLAKYPQAKVILTVRDPEQWHESVLQTIYAFSHINTRFLPFVDGNLRMTRALIWEGVFNGRFTEREYAIQKFNEHIAHVKESVPPEKLLLFNVQEGWQPLCRFLDVPIPTHPFPHVNDRAVMQKRVGQLKKLSKIIPISLFVGCVALLCLLYHGLRRK